jgi:hypothetical protein
MQPTITDYADIVIWQPRYKDKTVLIAKYKVRERNKITFTKANHLTGEYYLSGDTIKNSPLETNGSIACYAVKVDELQEWKD